MKKFLFAFSFILVIAYLPNTNFNLICKATTVNLETELESLVNEQIDMLDLSELSEYFNDSELFDGESLQDYLKQLISGEKTIQFGDLLNIFINGIKNNLNYYLKLILFICIICLLGGLFNNFVSGKLTSQLQNAINLALSVIAITIISTMVINSVNEVKQIVETFKSFYSLIFPILFAFMITLGATKSVALYKPAVPAILFILTKVISGIILTLVIVYFICIILNSLQESSRLNKLCSFILTLIKYVFGIVLTAFVGYLSIQGITASTGDGVSIKTAKYAIRTYVPIVGGYLAEGFEVFKAGCLLIKNSVGVVCLIIMFNLIIASVVKFILLNLSFKFSGAVAEFTGSKQLSTLITSASNIFNVFLACLLILFMIGLMFIMLIVLSANSVIS